MDNLKQGVLWILLALTLMGIGAYIQQYRIISQDFQAKCLINLEKQTKTINP